MLFLAILTISLSVTIARNIPLARTGEVRTVKSNNVESESDQLSSIVFEDTPTWQRYHKNNGNHTELEEFKINKKNEETHKLFDTLLDDAKINVNGAKAHGEDLKVTNNAVKTNKSEYQEKEAEVSWKWPNDEEPKRSAVTTNTGNGEKDTAAYLKGTGDEEGLVDIDNRQALAVDQCPTDTYRFLGRCYGQHEID